MRLRRDGSRRYLSPSRRSKCNHNRIVVFMGEWLRQRSFSFFLPLSMRRGTRTWKNRKAKRSAGKDAAAAQIKSRCSRCRSCTTPNHPFKVRDDRPAMQEATESIRQYGVLVPAIVRPREGGGYEIIMDTGAGTAASWRGFPPCPASCGRWTTTPPPSSWWTARTSFPRTGAGV